ncbi:MAG: SOS response-associated peptidase family protein [Armatimonadota bacterium]|nr:SOS response-associated peptidase family protein [Armatimonadota bacterium]
MCYNLALEATRERFRDELGWDPGAGYVPLPRVSAFDHPVLPLRLRAGGVDTWVAARWGLVPRWLTRQPRIEPDDLFNARWETAAVKPAFRQAFQTGRAVVPATGFWEWRPVPGSRRKELVGVVPEAGWLYLGALASYWEATGQWTFVILTMRSNGLVAGFHDRQPLCLPPDRLEEWLAGPLADQDGWVLGAAEAEAARWRLRAPLRDGQGGLFDDLL